MPILLAAALSATPPQLAPLDFLIGHCWRGALANLDADTHCFKLAGGQVIDHHDVVHDGKSVYSGDTVYAWTDGALHWTYTSVDGGTMAGEVHGTPAGLDYGTTDYVGKDGGRLTMTVRWDHAEGADSYVAVHEVGGNARSVRYTRID